MRAHSSPTVNIPSPATKKFFFCTESLILNHLLLKNKGLWVRKWTGILNSKTDTWNVVKQCDTLLWDCTFFAIPCRVVVVASTLVTWIISNAVSRSQYYIIKCRSKAMFKYRVKLWLEKWIDELTWISSILVTWWTWYNWLAIKMYCYLK